MTKEPSAMREAAAKPYLMTGTWELDPTGENPGIYIDDPAGGDPICLCTFARIYHPEKLRTALAATPPIEGVQGGVEQGDRPFRNLAIEMVEETFPALPATQSTDTTGVVERLDADEALRRFGEDKRLALDYYCPVYGDDDDQAREWRVTKESGPINDREWDIIGRGDTPLAAILAALSSTSEGEGTDVKG